MQTIHKLFTDRYWEWERARNLSETSSPSFFSLHPNLLQDFRSKKKKSFLGRWVFAGYIAAPILIFLKGSDKPFYIECEHSADRRIDAWEVKTPQWGIWRIWQEICITIACSFSQWGSPGNLTEEWLSPATATFPMTRRRQNQVPVTNKYLLTVSASAQKNGYAKILQLVVLGCI